MSAKWKDMISVMVLTIIFTLLATLSQGLLTILAVSIVTALLGYATTKFHYVYITGLSVLIIAIYLLFYNSVLSTITSAIPVILCGLTLGISYNLKFSVFKLLCVFTTVYVLYIAINIKLVSLAFVGENFFESFVASLGTFYEEALQSFSEAKLSADEINAVVSEFTSAILRFSPSFLLILCILIALLSYFVFWCVLRLKKTDTSLFAPFSMWHAEKGISITYFILMILSLFIPSGFLADVLLNMITVMCFVFYVLGISLLLFNLKKKALKKFTINIIMTFVIVLSITMIGLPFLVISFAGAFDGFFDYRRRLLKR